MFRYLVIAAVLAIGASAARASEVTDDAAKLVAAKHLKKGLALSDRGRLAAAEREFDLGIASYSQGAALFAARGKVRYARKNYPGAVEDFDIYLAANPDDSDVILLRGLARSLLKPEDVDGACADFLRVREHLKNMGLEKYCAGRAGW
jgi:tetratricopeptide (TPR) repeat protein